MALHDLLTRPPRLPRAVDRPRLRHRLLDGVEPGRLVVAPPGSGKTVAAAQVLGTDEHRTAWCRLAPGAAGGADLVRLIAAAVGTEVDEPGPGPGPLEQAAAVLDVLDSVGDEPLVLVVDDYELARPEECDAVLAEVVGLLPPDCRLIVCSALRPAGLVGRSSVGQLAVIDADDLAFTEAEVAELLDLLGQPVARAGALRTASAGWATAVAVLAEVGGRLDSGLPAALEVVLDRAGLTPDLADPVRADVLALLATAPAVGPAEVAAAGLDPDLLTTMATGTALLRPVGDRWTLLDAMREPVRQRLGTRRLRQAAHRLAPALADSDPLTAAGMLLDVGDDAGAADLLARHASAVASEDVVPLLYRMRPEVRRQLPPLLSRARATVEMDAALAGAERRVASAASASERAEAQVAVGTILLHRGQLASACAALESALRNLGDPASAGAAAAAGWLGLARLWAGDLDGAAAALSGVDRAAPTSSAWSLARWAAAELALGRSDADPDPDGSALERVGRLVGDLRAGEWEVAAGAVAARLALAHGAEGAAADHAATAYRAAASVGGLDLLVAGPVHAWCLARAGRWDEAAAVADELRRRLGAVDTCARLHSDLIAAARAAAGADDDAAASARHARAIAATRRLGYAPVESAARRWLPSGPPEEPKDPTARPRPVGLEVAVLGPVVATVDGLPIEDRAWRSRKAREVFVLLALAGETGRSRDEVIEAVWPDRDPAKGRSLLRTALADVRRVLEPSRPPGEPSRFVAGHGDRLVVTARTDLAEVERLRARASSPAELAEAWARFRGDLAADDPYAESLDEARRAAGQLRSDLAEAILDRALDRAEPASRLAPDRLVDVAAWVVEREPWRTDLVALVAQACRIAGDAVAAARAERLVG
jgi:DNA-binding SARP family transcriptional activator